MDRRMFHVWILLWNEHYIVHKILHLKGHFFSFNILPSLLYKIISIINMKSHREITKHIMALTFNFIYSMEYPILKNLIYILLKYIDISFPISSGIPKNFIVFHTAHISLTHGYSQSIIRLHETLLIYWAKHLILAQSILENKEFWLSLRV